MKATGRFLAHSSLALAPFLYGQALYTRARTARLPEAAGPRTGRVAAGSNVIQILLLGESTVAGVGVARHDEGLAGQTARSISVMTGATVDWYVHAANGITAAGLRSSLSTMPPDIRTDLVVIGLGANDVFRLQGPTQWARDLRALIDSTRERCGFAPVMLSAMPPIGHFPGLPQPLRSILGLRARLLDDASQRLAEKMHAVHFVPMSMEPDESLFCSDGIHPSAACYSLWGSIVAEAALTRLPLRG